jgi:ABC-type Fe3+ transport system permease subunit
LGLSLIFWSLLDKILNRKPIPTAKILKFIIYLVIVGLLYASFSLPRAMRPLFNGIKKVEKALLKKGIIASSLKPIMPFGLKDIALAIIGGLLILFISDLLVYLVRKKRCSLRDFCLYGPMLCSLFKDERGNPSLQR